uniref:Protein-lysine N-methyltransferase EOG090X0ABW n=1 Tax=Lynceus sp. MCZ IZ 141354 TaxID=1930659 RepID=A0A9N6WU92_9CRUS|nr:EOG090X0ABW [Lynceus sp. MCZ IZ 141354]
MSDSDDETTLSSHAHQALLEFLAEKKEREEKLEIIKNSQEQESVVDIELEENWQLSQFWYDEKTTKTLGEEALRLAGESGSIACISCPTIYRHLRKNKPQSCNVKLLEFDTRFAMYGEDFLFYDYRSPLELPRDMQSGFNVVIADPPFLSEECLTKTAVTIKFLAKGAVILCTGAIMEDLAKRLLHLNLCNFLPHHSNNLANDFRCFSNYNLDEFIQ